jgi:hypothetical protein
VWVDYLSCHGVVTVLFTLFLVQASCFLCLCLFLRLCLGSTTAVKCTSAHNKVHPILLSCHGGLVQLPVQSWMQLR